MVLDVGSRDPDSPYARRKTTKLDPSCTYVYGPDGAARVKKLETYAAEFNKLMLDYVARMGMLSVYPDDARPYTQGTAAGEADIERRAKELLIALLASPSPELSGTRLWKTDEGEDYRLFIETKLSPAEFAKRFLASSWKEIPLSVEARETTHLPRGTPKSYMTSFVGKVGALPSYVFWSQELGSFALLVAFDGARK